MPTIPPIIDQAEALVRELASELTRVRPGECLCCYVARQLDEFPCDNTHRHALRFRDATAPRATALRERLGRVGACCCDCELFLNAYAPDPRVWTPEPAMADEDLDEDLDGGLDYGGDAMTPLPACAGVRRGSVQPCRIWLRQHRW